MPEIIDARSKPCPQPVLLAAEALKKSDDVTVIVDNPGSQQNVAKFGKTQGCSVTVEEKADGIYIHLTKMAVASKTEAPKASGIVVFIGSDVIGRGENIELGSLLMQSFLNTLQSLPNRPETILFMNNGVKLVAEGSHVIGELKQLADSGIELLACGTCLSRLGLSNKIAVGHISNMFTIADTMMRASKVISL
ncbi:sulfurtransferase-like selenium metabolism protein YedF [Dehalogenimonas etheniformans]|uniref:Sulfurtransferase-like selenium metabolism protein YedF n=1 Tax=Dehalogenimonas etheniformans TaxID=1536648 RepID=A0A2P5P5B0_9CHLR|nr:sulfurtransferase-like selenium metabolism protein YedF [Dehalogenimonas etheniformans]PPD57488.1 sulfurtransferase-like selenium metabolism protein YedF [Dehalogenimonas etheniformans]QNT76851.1 sulfurtransferase-like selenium metabolism protein YedF [Dehalogenimonas etheniformans]